MIKGCETAIRPSLLRERQGYSLRGKIYLSQQRIREWYEHWEGKVYVAFSGGKDSTVLLDLVRKLYPEVPGVFADTGLEYPEIKEFVHSVDNIEWIRPRMSYRQVISAADVGAPHLRKRIWIVAYPTKGNDGGSNREKASGQTQELGKSSGRNNLSDTPEQGFRTGEGHRWETPEKRSRNLNDKIAFEEGYKTLESYPIPTKNANQDCPSERRRNTPALESFVKMLPTPTTPRPHDNEKTVRKFMSSQNQQDLTSSVAKTGGQLNPTWTSWLMGFPLNWLHESMEETIGEICRYLGLPTESPSE